MVRHRWTLALILICLSILATVITAFRVRDLPRSEDSVKFDKKQKCNECDVKFSHSLRSGKPENDKHVYEDLKSTVRAKQQLNLKKSESKTFHDSNVSNEEDNFKIKPVATTLKLEVNTKKFQNSNDGLGKKTTLVENSNERNIKKIEKPEQDLKRFKIKNTVPKLIKYNDDVNHNTEDDDDDEDIQNKNLNKLRSQKEDYKVKQPEVRIKPLKPLEKIKNDDISVDDQNRIVSKPKILETRTTDMKSKLHMKSQDIVDSKQTTTRKKDESNDDDSNDDNDEDDEDDDDDDDDGVLSSLWETFSMLGLDIDLSIKPASKKEKQDKLIPNLEKQTKEDNKESDIGNYKSSIPAARRATDESNKIIIKKELPKEKQPALKVSTYKAIEISDEDNENDDDDDDGDDDDDDVENIFESKRDTQKSKTVMTNSKNMKPPQFPTKHVKIEADHYVDNDKDANKLKEKVRLHGITQEKDRSSVPPIKISKDKRNYDDDESDEDEDDNGDEDDDESDDSKMAKPGITIKRKKMDDEVLLVQKTDVVDKKGNIKNTVKDKNEENKKEKPMNSETVQINKHITVQEGNNNKRKSEKDQVLRDSAGSKERDTKILDEKPKDKEKAKQKSNDKEDKLRKPEEPKKVESKGKSSEVKDDTIEKLNIQEIKKEIKAQIRSSREDKRADKLPKDKHRDMPNISSSTESNLKQVTDALHRRNLLKSEFEDFYAFFPTFAPNFSRIHNPECRRHGQIVLRQLRGTKLWALNMLDATAKIPSGILQGNGIQLGDFDQCIQSRARVQLESGSVVKVQGKYCLARLDVKAEHPELEIPVHLAQAKNLMRSRIDDPGHFVPRFSTLNWGVCMPDVCNPEDVEMVIKDAIKHYQKTSGVIIRVKVDEQDCHTEEADWWNEWLELPTLLTLSFYGIIILFVLVATLQDFFTRGTDADEETKEKKECDAENEKEGKTYNVGHRSGGLLSSFSLYHTINKLLAPGTTDDISCIHGIRGIATIALLIAHKFLPVAGMPYTNRMKITETVSSPLWSWCRAGWMYTDCFLLLSGALTAYKASKTDGAPRRLFSRYLRLTPALLAVVLFYAFIWDNISVGPMWGTFVTKNAQVCQEKWWWNLLYVQNYFGLEDMCAPQTHQLALDMQLTVIGGILLWVMQINSRVYMLILPAMHIFAAFSRYTNVRDHRLTMLAYHGVSVSQLYRTARLSYTSVLHRSTPYLVGISLGLALKNPGEHGKFVLGVGWLSSLALWCLVWWAGADSGSIQYRYHALFAAQYAALAPIASALAIAWIIYAVHSGGNGFLSRFLCCRPLVFISRLSYALYLTQFIIFITNIGTVKTSSEFSLMSLIDIQEISAIILSSIILTLTLVIPMQSVPKMFTFSLKSVNSRKLSVQGENKLEVDTQENHTSKPANNVEVPQMKMRQHLIAHREVLEEIPETEVEYETQRDNDVLGEILEEEEEDELGEESFGNIDMDDELEVIEEEQGGEDDIEESILNRRQYTPRRSYSNEDDQDLDEWEWTTNSSRNGAQYYQYSR